MGFWLAFFKKQQKIKQQKNQPLKLWYFKIPFSWKVLLFEKLNLAGLWYQFGAIRRLKAYCFLFTRRCWGLLLLQIFRDCCMLLWVVVDRWVFFFFYLCGLLLDVLSPCGSLPIAVFVHYFSKYGRMILEKKDWNWNLTVEPKYMYLRVYMLEGTGNFIKNAGKFWWDNKCNVTN